MDLSGREQWRCGLAVNLVLFRRALYFGAGLLRRLKSTHPPSFPIAHPPNPYADSAAFRALEPLSFFSGLSAFAGRCERRMALARWTAASRRSGR